MIVIEQLQHVDQLVSASWDDLVGAGDFYASTDGLRYYEEFLHGRAWYLIGRSSASSPITAGLSCHLLDTHDPASPFTRLDQVIAHLLGENAGSSAELRARYLLPTLLCGSRTAGCSRILCQEHNPLIRQQQLSHLITEAEALARKVGARTLSFLYADDNDLVLKNCLQEQGWLSIRNSPYYIFDITWKDFAEYLSLFGGRRRRSIRRERQKLRNAGVEMRVEKLNEALIPDLAMLEERLKRRYGSPRTAEDIAASLHTLVQLYPERVIAVTAHQADTLRGFTVNIQWRDELVGRDAGFDYEFQQSAHLPLYFETLFYTPAEWAPEHGIRRIYFGMGSDEAKQSRGCKALEQTSFIKALDAETETYLQDILAQRPMATYEMVT